MYHRILSPQKNQVAGFSYIRAASFVYHINKLVQEDNLFVKDTLGNLPKLTPLVKTLIHYLKQQMPFFWDDIDEWYGLPGKALLRGSIEKRIKASFYYLNISEKSQPQHV